MKKNIFIHTGIVLSTVSIIALVSVPIAVLCLTVHQTVLTYIKSTCNR